MSLAKLPKSIAAAALGLLLVFVLPVRASAQPASRPTGRKDERPTTRLRIEVTAGNANQPVAEASVYLKFDDNPNAKKPKQIEMNLKTSQEGVALSPAVPQGKILIQIIAPGWKTYGEWFDVEQPEQTVHVHLLPNPTKWY